MNCPIIEYTPEMAIQPPCIITGMPNDVYHSWPNSVSKSQLDLIDRSPAHLRYAAKRESTRAMEIGTAIHTALLEPERFASEYVLLRDVTDRRASEYKQAIKVHSSDVVLTGTEADHVSGMQESVYAQPSARGLLTAAGHHELSVFANDPETGVLCRVRIDLLTDDMTAVDLKKTRDARNREFQRSVFNYRYHVQDAFYSDVFFWATGEHLNGFKFIAVEEQPPHAAVVYSLDDEARKYGRDCYRANLNTYAKCLESNDWHGYDVNEDVIGLPGWLINEIENEMEITTEDDV